MNENDIIVNNCYEAKNPRLVGNIFSSYVNDRQIIYISSDRSLVQYDSPSVKNGGKYPTITMEKFLKWAGRNITIEMPKENWRTDLQKVTA